MRLKHILLLFLLSFGLGYSQTNNTLSVTSTNSLVKLEKSKLKLKAESGDINDLIFYVDEIIDGAYGITDWNEVYEMLTKAQDAGSAKASLYLFIM